jgi:hypothetical protein
VPNSCNLTCFPWETLFATTAGLRIMRRGWRLRARMPRDCASINDIDLLTRDLTGHCNRRLQELVPDYARNVLLVGLRCMALPRALAERLWRLERLVAIDTTPFQVRIMRRFFNPPPQLTCVPSDGSNTLTTAERISRQRFQRCYDCVVLEHDSVPNAATIDAAVSVLIPHGKLVVRVPGGGPAVVERLGEALRSSCSTSHVQVMSMGGRGRGKHSVLATAIAGPG